MSLLIRKTAAEFTAANPILLPNQIGQETDFLQLMKVGDGLTAWNNLDYEVPIRERFEQVLSGDKDKVPSSYAVMQASGGGGVYVKDGQDNIFAVANVGNTFALGSSNNKFEIGANNNIIENANNNIFEADANNNILYGGNNNKFEADANNNILYGGNNSILEAGISNFIFADSFNNVTIKSGAIGANYTIAGYGFLYNKNYPSEIFFDGTANFHKYYDVANDRIVLTNLATLAVSYIGGGGGGLSQQEILKFVSFRF